jgi:TonB family protein
VYIFALVLLGAQQPGGSGDVFRVGPGVTLPRVLHKVEPEYSPIAQADHVQGTLILQIIVNEKGRATDITVLSPIGFGLDERAEMAVEKWEFIPGRKDGKPVKILATIEVNFRFPGLPFDDKSERQRTAFNVALQTLKRTDTSPTATDRAIKTMQDLCSQKYPPAMYLVGMWKTTGERVAKDPEDGFAWIQKAAAKNYGPALYELAVHRLEGRDLPKDLGNLYEKGQGVPQEVDRARRYFRLCAAQGVAVCQYRLGILLLNAPDRPDRDYVQAVALFQLASEQSLQEAKDIASREAANLTAAQSKWVDTLKTQLVRK